MPDNLIRIAAAVALAVAAVAVLWMGLVYMRRPRRRAPRATSQSVEQGKPKVIRSGDVAALPVLDRKAALSDADTLRLEVACRQGQGLTTLDRGHVDLTAIFLMRVGQAARPAGTGERTVAGETTDPAQLRGLFQDKFIEALRTTAATTTMKALQNNPDGFARAVRDAATRDVEQHGLELESVLLISLEQTAGRSGQDAVSGAGAPVQAQSPQTSHPKPDSSQQQELAMQEQQKPPNPVKPEAERKYDVEHETRIAPAERHQAWEKAGIATSRTSLTEPPVRTEAEGIATVNEAKNRMGAAQIDLAVRMQLIQSMPDIVTQALKPTMEQDGSIRPPQQHQVVRSIVDAIMKDAGLGNHALCDIVQIVAQVVTPVRAARSDAGPG
jgi:uncharacterized membrane protein YqiK